jgi:hypothetical protein
MNFEHSSQSGRIARKIGTELEIPLTREDYSAAQYVDLENLYNELISQGWHGKYDTTTGSLIGVKRKTSKGVEVVETDLGICTLEIALAPALSLKEAVYYWLSFKSDVLLPLTRHLNLRLLGYGNQPRSGDLKSLIASKGHYQIYNTMFSDDVREWFLQNFPGLASVQFNIEIPNERSIQILNTLLALSPLIWAASNNDSIAVESLLPYKSQRFFAYQKIAGETLTDRYGTPQANFRDICEYIYRMWDLPIFEIIREGKPLRPVDRHLTTNQYIRIGSASFMDMNNHVLMEEVTLEDLKTAIYFSWLDFRLKISFCDHVEKYNLIQVVHTGDHVKLIQMLDHVILEVRPISMQSHQREIDWMIFMYLILENIDDVTEYVSTWSYGEVYHAVHGAQEIGLNQPLGNKQLGEIGLDLLNLVAHSRDSWSWNYLSRIQSQFSQRYSPGDSVAKIFREHGLQAALEYMSIIK